MTQNSFSEHVKNCDLFSGKLLSATFEANDPDMLVAKKMMNSQSQDKIYLGTYAQSEIFKALFFNLLVIDQ